MKFKLEPDIALYTTESEDSLDTAARISSCLDYVFEDHGIFLEQAHYNPNRWVINEADAIISWEDCHTRDEVCNKLTELKERFFSIAQHDRCIDTNGVLISYLVRWVEETPFTTVG